MAQAQSKKKFGGLGAGFSSSYCNYLMQYFVLHRFQITNR